MKKRRWSLSTLWTSLIILWIFLCFYVFLYSKLVAVGYKLEEAKKSHEELVMINKTYKAEILSFSSPANLLKTANAAGIDLMASPSGWFYVDVKRAEPAGVKINDTAEAGTR
jgi:cell division protein FtsL